MADGIPFTPDWPAPAPRFLREETLPAPVLPLEALLAPRWAAWVRAAAAARSAPVDYVFGALLACTGALIGNARWAWPGLEWRETPFVWIMAVGAPSAGKTPAISIVTDLLKPIQRREAEASRKTIEAWETAHALAQETEKHWKRLVKDALAADEPPPGRPSAADPGPRPPEAQLVVHDATIEKLAQLLEARPKGLLILRDELAGLLGNMERYSNGTDRPFYLEAWNGGSYTVERRTSGSIRIERNGLGLLGGIQPDRMRTLLLEGDDDGFLARFIPIWPEPAPLNRRPAAVDRAFAEAAFERLSGLAMVTTETGYQRPWYVGFTEAAQDVHFAAREWARAQERDCPEPLAALLGKFPGMIARVALLLAHLDWAVDETPETFAWTGPQQDGPLHVDADAVERAFAFCRDYVLPMARRCYGIGAQPQPERAAHALVALLRAEGLERFATREILRMERRGLQRAEQLDPALDVLEDAGCILRAPDEGGRRGGRPPRAYLVNPALLGA